MFGISIWIWALFLSGIIAMLAIDLGVFNRKTHQPSMKESVGWTVFYVMLAIVFGFCLPLFHPAGGTAALEFFTAYSLEKTLSFDNIFVMSLIFGALGIPKEHQHRVLFWGILGVIVLRGVFITLGAAIVSQFFWVLALFGLFLIYTGIKTFFIEDEQDEVDVEKSRVLQFLRRFFKISRSIFSDSEGRGKFTVKVNQNWYITPLLVALIMVEVTDLVFALDSIPAAFAVTQDAFVIFTANIFAIFGLRSLYFVLLNLLDKFEYLGKAVSIVLTFIGVKILLAMPTPLHFHIPPDVSLAVVLSLLGGGVLLSLAKVK